MTPGAGFWRTWPNSADKMHFQRHIGIDYSGRAEPTTGTAAIQVYEADVDDEPHAVRCPGRRSWNRVDLAAWLVGQLTKDERLIVGIDHAFSFPKSYMRRHNLSQWDGFLTDFRRHWPTHRQSVESLRADNPRHGDSSEFRLTDRWTSSAKSVFLFDVNGSVAKSTHAGLPWLLQIREECGDRVFFWPFDGWTPPPGRHVITEVYPSIFRNRYRECGLKRDALDAFAVAMWLREMDTRGFLGRYFDPALTPEQQDLARLEGWILGVL